MNRVSHWMGLALIVTGALALLVVGQAAPSDSRVMPDRERFTLPEPPEVPELPEMPAVRELPEIPELPEMPAVPELPEIPEPRLAFGPHMRSVAPMRGANTLAGVIVVLIGVYLILSRPSQTAAGSDPAAR